MSIALVVAMARNRVIGRDNALPWHLPGDLRYFRNLTFGKPVIMGRLTFESIGRPLPGRTNIVISSGRSFEAPAGVIRVADIAAALNVAEEVARRDGVGECMVIGGAQVYAQCLDRADRIYLTLVQAECEGDAQFPALDMEMWAEVECQAGENVGEERLEYSHIVFDRRKRDGFGSV